MPTFRQEDLSFSRHHCSSLAHWLYRQKMSWRERERERKRERQGERRRWRRESRVGQRSDWPERHVERGTGMGFLRRTRRRQEGRCCLKVTRPSWEWEGRRVEWYKLYCSSPAGPQRRLPRTPGARTGLQDHWEKA